MKIEACCKLNFTLEVFPKRADGYHALRSVVVPITLSDTISIEPADDISSDTGYGDADLCVKAARALGVGCRICVEKRIPAGGGLGGGSADAAAVLRALNEMKSLGHAPEELAEIGASVGSDVPALVLAQSYREPIVMEGRGEKVSRLFGERSPASVRLRIALVNPGVFSSTAEVYSKCSPRLPVNDEILYNMRTALESGDPHRVAAALQNDLEAPAVALHPEIAAAKGALAEAGAFGVAMTGSGSTVFGLVPDDFKSVPWCSGRTGVFDTLSLGSNPSGTTIR